MLRILLAFFLFAMPAQASEKIVADLSQDNVSITATFDGTSIVIFGAVKRLAPPPETGPLQVLVEVAGPSLPITVRQKEKIYGIWANKDSAVLEGAPSFYAIASTAPLGDILSEAEGQKYKVSVERLIQSSDHGDETVDAGKFGDAVIRIRQDNGLYSENTSNIDLKDETLFRTQIKLPSNLVEGDYQARIFLTRDKAVIDKFETTIAVRKVGLERWIFNLAHQQPLIYGLLSLAIAIVAGWMASAVFRLLRLN